MSSNVEKKLAKRQKMIASVSRKLQFGSSSGLPTTARSEEQEVVPRSGGEKDFFENQRIELERLNAERDKYPLLPEILALPEFPVGKDLDMDGYYDENGPNDIQRELQIDLGMDRFNRWLPVGKTIVEMYDYYFEGVRFSFSEEKVSNGTCLTTWHAEETWLEGFCDLADYGSGWGTADEGVNTPLTVENDQSNVATQLEASKGKKVLEVDRNES